MYRGPNGVRCVFWAERIGSISFLHHLHKLYPRLATAHKHCHERYSPARINPGRRCLPILHQHLAIQSRLMLCCCFVGGLFWEIRRCWSSSANSCLNRCLDHACSKHSDRHRGCKYTCCYHKKLQR